MKVSDIQSDTVLKLSNKFLSIDHITNRPPLSTNSPASLFHQPVLLRTTTIQKSLSIVSVIVFHA